MFGGGGGFAQQGGGFAQQGGGFAQQGGGFAQQSGFAQGGFAQAQPAAAPTGGKGALNNAALLQLVNGQWQKKGTGLVTITTGAAPQLLIALVGTAPFQEPVNPVRVVSHTLYFLPPFPYYLFWKYYVLTILSHAFFILPTSLVRLSV